MCSTGRIGWGRVSRAAVAASKEVHGTRVDEVETFKDSDLLIGISGRAPLR